MRGRRTATARGKTKEAEGRASNKKKKRISIFKVKPVNGGLGNFKEVRRNLGLSKDALLGNRDHQRTFR